MQEYDHIPTEDVCYFPTLSKVCLEETHKALSQRQDEEVMKHAIAFAKTYIDEFFPLGSSQTCSRT